MTEVVAALIWKNDRFMICRRPADKARGGLWEFAGGKVEPGETKEQALIRECREELAVTVSVGAPFMEVTHEYPDIAIRLTLFEAAVTQGVPRALEHSEIRWITPAEAPAYDFCPADKEILKKLASGAAHHIVKKAPSGAEELSGAEERIRSRLFALQDLKYRDFQCGLMPSVDRGNVIGVRTPEMRKLAKELAKTPDAAVFLKILPHRYYEENNLHGFLIETIGAEASGDFDRTIKAVDDFLPYVDNWATCDLMAPKVFKKNLPALYEKIREWIRSGRTYTVRFGIGMLMRFFLDENFRPEMMELVAGVRSEEYYVKMMIAWYFATALAKQYDAALPYLLNRRLERWTHNKTIQKAIESYRISDEKKACLRALKV